MRHKVIQIKVLNTNLMIELKRKKSKKEATIKTKMLTSTKNSEKHKKIKSIIQYYFHYRCNE